MPCDSNLWPFGRLSTHWSTYCPGTVVIPRSQSCCSLRSFDWCASCPTLICRHDHISWHILIQKQCRVQYGKSVCIWASCLLSQYLSSSELLAYLKILLCSGKGQMRHQKVYFFENHQSSGPHETCLGELLETDYPALGLGNEKQHFWGLRAHKVLFTWHFCSLKFFFLKAQRQGNVTSMKWSAWLIKHIQFLSKASCKYSHC